MLPANAAALVGAGVVSVLVFPAIAAAVSRHGRAQRIAGEPVPVAGAVEQPDQVIDLTPAFADEPSPDADQ
jgi:hypothetical protein